MTPPLNVDLSSEAAALDCSLRHPFWMETVIKKNFELERFPVSSLNRPRLNILPAGISRRKNASAPHFPFSCGVGDTICALDSGEISTFGSCHVPFSLAGAVSVKPLGSLRRNTLFLADVSLDRPSRLALGRSLHLRYFREVVSYVCSSCSL